MRQDPCPYTDAERAELDSRYPFPTVEPIGPTAYAVRWGALEHGPYPTQDEAERTRRALATMHAAGRRDLAVWGAHWIPRAELERRQDHSAHRAYLIPECPDCNSPEAIAARRAARALDTPADPCPKLGGLNNAPHVINASRHAVRISGGRRKTRCVYCSRTIDLGPAPEPVRCYRCADVIPDGSPDDPLPRCAACDPWDRDRDDHDAAVSLFAAHARADADQDARDRYDARASDPDRLPEWRRRQLAGELRPTHYLR